MVSYAPEITTTRTNWAFDPAHTSVGFKAKHMMITTVRGKFNQVTGTIAGDLEQAHLAEIDVAIDAASIDSQNEQRDAHLRSADFLDAENYPTIAFKSRRIEPVKDGQFKVIGDLSIRGVTREITLDAEVNGAGKSPWGTEVVGITVTGELNRKDYGLTWNVALEAGGWLVGDTIKIEIDIEAIKQETQ
jgi:polyisoprenoid-binding protein YceI